MVRLYLRANLRYLASSKDVSNQTSPVTNHLITDGALNVHRTPGMAKSTKGWTPMNPKLPSAAAFAACISGASRGSDSAVAEQVHAPVISANKIVIVNINGCMLRNHNCFAPVGAIIACGCAEEIETLVCAPLLQRRTGQYQIIHRINPEGTDCCSDSEMMSYDRFAVEACLIVRKFNGDGSSARHFCPAPHGCVWE